MRKPLKAEYVRTNLVDGYPYCLEITSHNLDRHVGYFRINDDGRHLAHRWVFGDHITADDIVLHMCNNPRCINPFHLKKGTQKENMMHMAECERYQPRHGQHNGMSKLRTPQVAEILKSDLTDKQLAKQYGVGAKTIKNIRTGTSWKHMQPKKEEPQQFGDDEEMPF